MSGEFDFFFFLFFFAMVSSIYASQRTLTRLHRFWITQSPEPWLQWPAWTTPLHRVQVSFFYKVHQYILSTVHWFHNWRSLTLWHAQAERRRIGRASYKIWSEFELDRLLWAHPAMVYIHTPLMTLSKLPACMLCTWWFTSFHVVWCRVATKGQRPLLVAKLLAAGSRVGSVEDYPWSQCPLYLAVMLSFYFFFKKSFFLLFLIIHFFFVFKIIDKISWLQRPPSVGHVSYGCRRRSNANGFKRKKRHLLEFEK